MVEGEREREVHVLFFFSYRGITVSSVMLSRERRRERCASFSYRMPVTKEMTASSITVLEISLFCAVKIFISHRRFPMSVLSHASHVLPWREVQVLSRSTQ